MACVRKNILKKNIKFTLKPKGKFNVANPYRKMANRGKRGEGV